MSLAIWESDCKSMENGWHSEIVIRETICPEVENSEVFGQFWLQRNAKLVSQEDQTLFLRLVNLVRFWERKSLQSRQIQSKQTDNIWRKSCVHELLEHLL